jgi:glutathione S-transferase
MSAQGPLALYGHPFSSYTWKAQIALDVCGPEYEFRIIDAQYPENGAFVTAHAGPFGTFPVLVDGDKVIFESTTIIEYLDVHYGPELPLIPREPDAAVRIRMLDRVFDNNVMNTMQIVVNEYIRDPQDPDDARCAEARAKLHKSYAWLEQWLPWYHQDHDFITLVECAAAPSLFYADWVEPIDPAQYPRLKAWRTHLLSLPPVAKAVEAARPYRSYFPLGAPDRD